MTHDIQVNGYNIVPDCVDVGTKGSYGNEKLQFNLSEQWKGLAVKVSFFPPNSVPVVVILGGATIDVPPEVTRNGGKSRYMISGHADGKLMKSLIGYLNSQNTLEVATTPPSSPTPTEMEQVYDWMQEALDLAQSVRDDADSGKFDGKDGYTPSFSVGSVERGEEPELSITGTPQFPVLNAVLPKGDTGATGAKGDTGDNGATYVPDVTEDGIILWENDKGLPNPTPRDITGKQGPAGVMIGVPPEYDPEMRAWINPDGESLLNEVIEDFINETEQARDTAVGAKDITVSAKDTVLNTKGEIDGIKEDIDSIHENIIDLEQSATESATSAGISEVNSKESETNAKTSETNSKESETNAELHSNHVDELAIEIDEDKITIEGFRDETEQFKIDAEIARDEAERYAEELSNVYNKNETDALLNLKANKLVDYEQGNILISDETGNISDSGYHINVLNDNYKRYGVSGVGGMNPTLTRLWNSVGLTANAGTDTTAPVNDFDDLPPFNRKKCVGYWIDGGGKAKFIVQAYEGDPDFAEDGTKGDYVAVEVSPFWYYQDDFSQHNPEQISGTLGVSPTPVPGWEPHPICLNLDGSIRQKTYLPCYALAQKDGKAVSLPGLENVSGHYKGLWDIARTYDDVEAAQYAMLDPMMVRHYEWLLFTIEYATTHCQSIMQGATSMPYTTNAITAISADTGVVTAAIGNNFVEGQRVYIGTTYSETHMGTHTIMGIERCDEDGTLNPSGTFRLITLDPISTVSDITTIANPTISTRPYPTGACNSVLTPSGSPVSNTSAKHPMRYRYRENIWGNQYSTCGDLIAKRIGEGTPESPYLIEWYYLIDPTYYPSSTSKPDDADLSSGAWIKLEQTSIYQNGYIRQIAMDKRYPHVITPVVSSGASSVTFYCDYVYHENTPIIRAVRLGGAVSSGALSGVLFFYAHCAPSHSSWLFGGGLYFLQ